MRWPPGKFSSSPCLRERGYWCAAPKATTCSKRTSRTIPTTPERFLTLLEGLALWCGAPLTVAISADVPSSHSLGLGPFSDDPEQWPEESALVHFEFVLPSRRGRRLRGLGDFASLRRLGLYR